VREIEILPRGGVHRDAWQIERVGEFVAELAAFAGDEDVDVVFVVRHVQHLVCFLRVLFVFGRGG
jgi:sugar phosphate isomerase/epimerase